ncbi:MAG: NADH-quinone oxidoreductase subunit J [Planctomycetes bacterium]|nr:NADH-quinone oxidoreductase subunit J [Planctomycetota bacterium]
MIDGGAGMIVAQWPLALATLLFAAGLWLLLPRGGRSGRQAGTGLVAAGLALLTLLVHFGLTFYRNGPSPQWKFAGPLLGSWAEDVVFLALAALTVGSAVCTVTFRSPVYCAIWFALTLLGVGGLFMYQGSQFLGVATVVVYAGAILVTFLFVLMLAQPEGHAFYDRVSWEAALSAFAGAVMVGVLTMALSQAMQPSQVAEGQPTPRFWLETDQPVDRAAGVLNPEHVASLGGRLFSTHLIAIEVAGTLLLVALVGAVAIVSSTRRLDHPARSVGGRAHG